MGNLVTDEQAGSMGGADKPAGAQAENTFQDNKVKQLVVLVRYKPQGGAFDTGAASSMLGGVTGAVEGAVGAVEGAMASIPGLDLFIKEDKKESTSEKEYTYHKDYSGWDKALKKAETGLKELNSENATLTFDFSSTDAAGRKSDAQDLLGKIKGKMGVWSQYTAQLHFIGLGQGGNVVNECTRLLAADSAFGGEKWHVQSVIYVGTAAYRKEHLPDEAAFKGKGRAFSFGSRYDLTQGGIACFEPQDKLVQAIQDANKNTLSLAVGKVKLRIIKALSIILSGLHLSAGDQSELNKFSMIKDEIAAIVTDVLDLVKQIIDEGAAFIKLGDLPEFGRIVDGYGDIPGKCVSRLQQFIDAFTKSAGDQAKQANVSLGPKDLAGALNCLCPLFDTVAASFAVFRYDSPDGQALAAQLIKKTGVQKVYAPAGTGQDELVVDPAYTEKAVQAAAAGQPELAGALVARVGELLGKAGEGGVAISAMSMEQQAAVAEAISVMIQPMMQSKKALYNKLLQALPFDLAAMTESFTASKLMDLPGGALSGIGIDFPVDLKASVARTDGELKRIRGYFDKSDYRAPEDSLYFIFNTHNRVLSKMWGPVAQCLDSQTGYLDFMKSKGYDNSFDGDTNTYTQSGEAPAKTNVLPAKELPVAG